MLYQTLLPGGWCPGLLKSLLELITGEICKVRKCVGIGVFATY